MKSCSSLQNMFIRQSFKSMSLFLGIFSVLVLFSVVLFDKYNGNVINKDNERFNSSNTSNRPPQVQLDPFPDYEADFLCTLNFRSIDSVVISKRIKEHVFKHVECNRKGVNIKLINVSFPQNTMESYWLNVAVAVNSLKIYSNTILKIKPRAFVGTVFDDLRSLTLSNVELVNEYGQKIRIAIPPAESTNANETKYTSRGICSYFKDSLNVLQVQNLQNNNPMVVYGNASFKRLEILHFRHNNFRDSIHKQTFANMRSLKRLMLTNCNIEYIWTDAFFFLNYNTELIDLSYNKMTRLTPGLFDFFYFKQDKIKIVLAENPWVCDCTEHVLIFERIQCLEQKTSKCLSDYPRRLDDANYIAELKAKMKNTLENSHIPSNETREADDQLQGVELKTDENKQTENQEEIKIEPVVEKTTEENVTQKSDQKATAEMDNETEDKGDEKPIKAIESKTEPTIEPKIAPNADEKLEDELEEMPTPKRPIETKAVPVKDSPKNSATEKSTEIPKASDLVEDKVEDELDENDDETHKNPENLKEEKEKIKRRHFDDYEERLRERWMRYEDRHHFDDRFEDRYREHFEDRFDSKYDSLLDDDDFDARHMSRKMDQPGETRQETRQEDSNTVEIECVDYYDPDNTETIRVQCRDYLMQITEVDSTTLRVELEESLPNYVLIWFNDSMVTVLEHETTEDDISCMSDLNTTNIITDLEAGLTYTFCILEKTSITISPFNCAAYYLARKETSPIWISTDKKSLTIGIAVALFVFFTWLGLVFGILLVRRNPTWLKGTKRVVVVNNRNNCPELASTASMDLSLEDNNAVENPGQDMRKNSLSSAKSIKAGYEVALHHSRFDIIKSKLDDTYVEKENKYYMDKIPNLQAPIPPEFDSGNNKESLYSDPKPKNAEQNEEENKTNPEPVYEKY